MGFFFFTICFQILCEVYCCETLVGYPPGLRNFGWFINLLSGLGDGPGLLDGSLRKFIFQRITRRDARIIDWAHVQFLFFPCFHGSESQDFDDNFRMHEFDQVNELLTMLWCLRFDINWVVYLCSLFSFFFLSY